MDCGRVVRGGCGWLEIERGLWWVVEKGGTLCEWWKGRVVGIRKGMIAGNWGGWDTFVRVKGWERLWSWGGRQTVGVMPPTRDTVTTT